MRHPFDANNQGALILKIIKGNYQPVSNQYSAELREVVSMTLNKDYRKRPNIANILSRTGLKERALSANLFIPESSVLSEAPVMMRQEIAPKYTSNMEIIE